MGLVDGWGKARRARPAGRGNRYPIVRPQGRRGEVARVGKRAPFGKGSGSHTRLPGWTVALCRARRSWSGGHQDCSRPLRPQAQRDTRGPNPGAARLAPDGRPLSCSTELFKQEHSFQEVHRNNQLRGEMGSYQALCQKAPHSLSCVPYIGFFHLSQHYPTVTHLSK